jgi:hypothetical protein
MTGGTSGYFRNRPTADGRENWEQPFADRAREWKAAVSNSQSGFFAEGWRCSDSGYWSDLKRAALANPDTWKSRLDACFEELRILDVVYADMRHDPFTQE